MAYTSSKETLETEHATDLTENSFVLPCRMENPQKLFPPKIDKQINNERKKERKKEIVNK